MSERMAQWHGEKEVAAGAAAMAQGRHRVSIRPIGQQVAQGGRAGGNQVAQGGGGHQVVRGHHRGRHRVARGCHRLEEGQIAKYRYFIRY